MAVVGYAQIPVSVSLRGIQGKIQAQLGSELGKASKSAGQVMERNLVDSAERAAKGVENARKREVTAAQGVADAELKVGLAKSKTEQATKTVQAAELDRANAVSKAQANLAKAEADLQTVKQSSKSTAEQLAAAEEKVTRARTQGESDVLKKENALQRARDNSLSAAARLEAAERGVASAKSKHADASDTVVKKETQLKKAQEGANDAADAGKNAFRRLHAEITQAGSSMEVTSKQADGFGSKIKAGFSKIGTGMLLGVGAQIGSTVTKGIGQSLSKGFERLTAVEQAKAALTGLGNSAEKVEIIMNNAMDSVKGTAFGFGEAAGLAGTLVASGIEPGEKLQRVLKLVGDSAAITGTDLGEMGSIWAKVAANGKLSTEEMNQLLDRNLGLLPKLSEKYGVTNEQMRKMISEGKVSFEDFADVMENMVGGAALKMGGTFKGSLQNMGAAMGRFGAKLLDPVFTSTPAVFTAMGVAFDSMTKAVDPAIEKIGENLKPAIEDVANFIEFKASPVLEALAVKLGALVAISVDKITDPKLWESLWLVWDRVRDTAEKLRPSLDALVTSFVTIAKSITVSTWEALVSVLNALAPLIESVLVPLVEMVAKFAEQNPGVIQAIVVAFLGFKGLSAIIGPVAGAYTVLSNLFGVFSSSGSILAALGSTFSGIGKVFSIAAPIIKTVVGMLGGPWVVAIGAAVAALTYFFTQTEMGQQIVENVISAIGTAWQTILKPVLDAVGATFQWLWDAVINVVLTWIAEKWNQTVSFFAQVWQSIFKPIIDAIGTAFRALWDSFVRPVLDWIGEKWQWLSNLMGTVWQWIKGNVFDTFQSSLTSLQDFFGNVVEGIGNVWNNLKRLLATPINFMIGTVYNDGIVEAWNIINDVLGLNKEMTKLNKIEGFATGGAIRGKGTGTSDDILSWLSNGEHVWTAKDVNAIGGQEAVYAMRKALEKGLPFTVDGKGSLAILPKTNEKAGDLAGAAPHLLIPGFKDGGEVKPLWEIQLENGHRAAQSRNGHPYTWGFEDCSGYMSMIADAILNGGNGVRRWATGSFPGGQPWVPGLAAGFSVGVHDNPGGPGGGHTAGTLTGVGGFSTVNVESGGGHGYVAYGGPAAGADSPQFRGVHPGQFHLGIGADGAFMPGGPGGGGVSPEMMKSAISAALGKVIDAFLNPIVGQLPSPPPEWKGIPKGVYTNGRKGLTDAVADGVVGLKDTLSTVWTAITKVPNLIREKLGGEKTNEAARAAVYDNGGVLNHGDIAVNQSGKPELVLTNWEWTVFNKAVEAFPHLADSLRDSAIELQQAFQGNNLGAEHISKLLNNSQLGIAIVQTSQIVGQIQREMSPVLEKAGKDYLTTQANTALDIFGLGGVIGLGEGIFNKVNGAIVRGREQERKEEEEKQRKLAEATNLTAQSTPSSDTPASVSPPLTDGGSVGEKRIVLEFKVDSEDDKISVKDIKALSERVDGLEVEIKTKSMPKASAVVGGGAV